MLKSSFQKHVLQFKFDAGTSRGILRQKETWFIKLWNSARPDVYGVGEAGPLKKLSIDDREDFEKHLAGILAAVERYHVPSDIAEIEMLVKNVVPVDFPSISFAMETALLDLIQGGDRQIYDVPFYHDGVSIPINGLIWMGDKGSMLHQISRKLRSGFDCIKMKIGSLDFQTECEVLAFTRNEAKSAVTLRVDANGAFSVSEALKKLEKLAEFDLHSIEQPIMPGQIADMKELCRIAPVPIALDEELIGVHRLEGRQRLLDYVQPQFIILKPTLLGGLRSCMTWIEEAENRNIGWWMTSALESNIGLNAIAQFTSYMKAAGHQGLGTGQLYENNISSPLTIANGYILYDRAKTWDLTLLDYD